ncbi:MAG: transglycosylase SLT domain-containing protein [Deltaproteobacteria bacterium]|nr:transglycosylase SLT domain-containing protein [Deltaproteobacteria bacterium]
MVNAGIEPYTVVDSHIADLWRGVLPQIVVHRNMALRRKGEIAWLVRKQNPLLKKNLNGFLAKHKKGTLKGNIFFRRYFKNHKWITNPLSRDDKKRLEKYVGWFKKYSAQYGIDWMLMAAQGYQESRLNQAVRSPAGAVGIMQLMPFMTEDKRLGIPEINKAEQNNHAGIK